MVDQRNKSREDQMRMLFKNTQIKDRLQQEQKRLFKSTEINEGKTKEVIKDDQV
jgi:hypothetical protein